MIAKIRVARFSGTEKAKLNIKISQKEPNSKLWRGDWGSRLFTLKISF
jgi:hypothetical protein